MAALRYKQRDEDERAPGKGIVLGKDQTGIEYARNGKPFWIFIHNSLEWPVLLVDVSRPHIGVTSNWTWWIADERFINGLPIDYFLLDSVGRPFTVVPLRRRRDGFRGIATERLCGYIEYREIVGYYRKSCEREGRTPPNLNGVRSLQDFVTFVLANRGLTI